jgi:hypothetical protein
MGEFEILRGFGRVLFPGAAVQVVAVRRKTAAKRHSLSASASAEKSVRAVLLK